MASPLRPGGGVLTGATSQEEFLCARTTLYPSLREKFYRRKPSLSCLIDQWRSAWGMSDGRFRPDLYAIASESP